MKILFTGFDPFGGESVNPAYEAIRLMPERILDVEIIKLEVPTVFYESGRRLISAIEQYTPDAVICVGQAGGRSAITPEKLAVNVMDGKIPDNAGYRPEDELICKDGAAAYFSKLPVRDIVEEIRSAGIPAAISYTAGTYVCNYLMYTLLDYIDKSRKTMLGGFIHVPYSAEQTADKRPGTPYMELTDITKGLVCAANAVINELRGTSLGKK